MLIVPAVLAVSLSLTTPEQYTYTRPFSSTNQIVGIGMGAQCDYTIVRAEDVAFLREAYCERTDVPFAAVPDGTNAIDRPLVARPRYSGDRLPAIFEDGDWGGCFSLSYTTNEMPFCQLGVMPGSFVRNGFRFDAGLQFEPVNSFPPDDWTTFRSISSNAVANGFAWPTNKVPATWFTQPIILSTNRICSLYAGLPLFNIAARRTPTENKTARATIYDNRNRSVTVSQYKVVAITNQSTGAVYSYAAAYDAFSVGTNDYEQTAAQPWYGDILESRTVVINNEFSIKRAGGSGTWPLVALGNYVARDDSRTFKTATNTFAWIGSPVKTNAQDDIQILQAVIAIDLTHSVYVARSWSNPSLPAGSADRYRTERTNIVNKATMCLEVPVSLDKSVGLNYNNTAWFYKMDVPITYIQNRANALFGYIDDYWPQEAKIEDSEIAATGTFGGYAQGQTYATATTSFGMTVFMVYSRTYKARTL